MRSITDRRMTAPWKMGIAAVAAVGLAITGFSPALAAETTLGPDDIIGYENGDEGTGGYNYDAWHIGSVSNDLLDSEASLDFAACSVTTLAVPSGSGTTNLVTQVMKGYPITARPSTTADIRAAIESISIDVESGTATIQLPFFGQYTVPGDPTQQTWLGTFWNTAGFGPGVHSLADSAPLTNDTLDSNPGAAWSNGDDLAAFYQLMDDEIDDALSSGDDLRFELLGIGFTGVPGTVVNSISFGGNTYYFGSGNCPTTAPTPPSKIQTAAK